MHDIIAEFFIRHPMAGRDTWSRLTSRHSLVANIMWVVSCQHNGSLGAVIQPPGVFLVPVEKRDAETLLPILQQYVLPGTTVVSDLWRASNTAIHFLEHLKELKMQMTQLQQMHSYLIQSLIDRTWPPLTKTQPLTAPTYMTQ